MTDEDDREARLKRLAEDQGLVLQRNANDGPFPDTLRSYMIVDPRRDEVVAGSDLPPFALNLDAVELWLTKRETPEEEGA